MVRLAVTGMSCGHCAGAITKAIEAAVKDAKVHVDLAGGWVNVTGTEDEERVRKAIVATGYRVPARAA